MLALTNVKPAGGVAAVSVALVVAALALAAPPGPVAESAAAAKVKPLCQGVLCGG